MYILCMYILYNLYTYFMHSKNVWTKWKYPQTHTMNEIRISSQVAAVEKPHKDLIAFHSKVPLWWEIVKQIAERISLAHMQSTYPQKRHCVIHSNQSKAISHLYCSFLLLLLCQISNRMMALWIALCFHSIQHK